MKKKRRNVREYTPSTHRAELVVSSLIWSLSSEALKETDKQCIREIKRIVFVPVRKLSEADLDEVEELKVRVWLGLAKIYTDEITVSLPQLIEVLARMYMDFFNEVDPNFQRHIDVMAMKVEINPVFVKDSYRIAKEFKLLLKKLIFDDKKSGNVPTNEDTLKNMKEMIDGRK